MSIQSFSCSKADVVTSLLLKGIGSDPIHDCASSLLCVLLWSWLQPFLGLFSKPNNQDWLLFFSFFSAGLLNLTSLVKELSTTGHDPCYWHNYDWHIRGLNLGQVSEGGCSSSGSELQGCLRAPAGPEETLD